MTRITELREELHKLYKDLQKDEQKIIAISREIAAIQADMHGFEKLLEEEDVND